MPVPEVSVMLVLQALFMVNRCKAYVSSLEKQELSRGNQNFERSADM